MPDTPNPPVQTPEQIAAAVEEASKPKTYEVKLSTGQVYKGENPEAVLDQLKSAQEQASVAIRDREQQIRELNAQLQEQQANRSAPVATDGTFDKAKFWKQMDEDPVKATLYALGAGLGLPEDQVAPTFQYNQRVTQVIADQMEVGRFHQNFPDFPGGKEAADLLAEETEKRGRYVYNADNLAVTFMELQREGRLKAVPVSTTQAQERELPPPSLPSGGGGGDATLSEATFVNRINAMSDEELEKLAVKMGAKK